MLSATEYLTGAGGYFGADPEFFFERRTFTGKQRIIGSDQIIPENGLRRFPNTPTAKSGFYRDGVQVELHPMPQSCRANMGNDIQECFKLLKAHLTKNHKDVGICLDPAVMIDKRTFDGMSSELKKLGCMPSKNLYKKDADVGVDGEHYRVRSAGGHIHLGLIGDPYYPAPPPPPGQDRVLSWFEKIPHAHERMVVLMDIIVGNTCVLIDRDPKNAERRKVYGRAGEYRTPKHGVEYRTLSNFWLWSYPLMSLVMGLTRLAVNVLYTSTTGSMTYNSALRAYDSAPPKWDPERKLLESINQEEIITAINTNDFNLALKNYAKLKEFISLHHGVGNTGLYAESTYNPGGGSLDRFDYFVEMVEKHGLKHFWNHDPMAHWCEKSEGHGCGIETFLNSIKRPVIITVPESIAS